MTGPALLRTWLKDSGTSQREFARILGIPEDQVSRIVRGKIGVGVNYAVAIKDHTGVPVESWVSPRRKRQRKQ